MSNKQISIVCSARMGHGTFEAKFKPLAMLDLIGEIVVVRKDAGPSIPKLSYKVLPSLCKKQLANMIIAPIVIYLEVKKHKASVILAYHYLPHFYFAYIVSKLTGVPYIIGQTGTDDQALSAKLIKGWFLRHVVRNAFSFNVPGVDSFNFWLSQGGSRERLRILHSTIDTEAFVPIDRKKEYDFIFVGRLTEVKRIDKLILAASNLKSEYPDLKICLVGSGPLEYELKEMIANTNVSQIFDLVGLQSNIHYWLTKSHAFVMTSDSEGLPCAMMEAMSTGLICIGPLVNNMADLLMEGKTGFGFDTKDVDQLTKIMRHVIYNRSQLTHMRMAARELIIAEHSYQVAQRSWIEVFGNL